jgi:hypothetical protein
MLKHAPESTEGTGARQSTRSELRTEVVWFPAAMLLLGFQVVVLMHGFGVPLPFELHAVYLAGVCLVGLCLVLLLLAIARTSVIWRPFAMATLIAGVAADMFVAASAATGEVTSGLWVALLVVTAWAAVWSITSSQSPL